MDCMIEDKRIITLKWRVEYKRPVEWDESDEPGVMYGQWPHDGEGRALVYTAGELGAVIAELDAARITYKLVEEDQPDPELLERLQGRVTMREEVFAALQSGKVPVILSDLEGLQERVKTLEDAKILP